MPSLVADRIPDPESFISERALLKPSLDPTPPQAAGMHKRLAVGDDEFADWLARAKQVAETAATRTAAVPSPTNWIRLGQARYAAGDLAASRDSAQTAMVEAIKLVEDGTCSITEVAMVLGSSAELLARTGRRDEALSMLGRLAVPEALQLTYASLLVDADQLEEALNAISSEDGPNADALRGYILARQGDAQRAVHYLRSALREAPQDADSVINLASAYWKLGSRTKAVATALRATRQAPSRQDISVSYLNLLLEDDQPTRVQAEVKRLRRSGVVESARLLVVECQAAFALGENKKALGLLRRALSAATAEGDETLCDEITANLRVLESSTSQRDRTETRQVARQCVLESPHNLAAIRQLAAHSARRHEAKDLAQALENVGPIPDLARLDLEARLAYLECDFESCLRAAERVVALDPMDADQCAMAILLEGWHRGNWESAARRASEWTKRAPRNESLVNNAAYAMALGQMPVEALKILDQHHSTDAFVPIATRGLAHLALGELDDGMRWYRRAAELADAAGAGDMCTLMALHQSAGLRKLGLVDVTNGAFLAATLLPDTPLPEDWADQPSFVMIQQGCEREGWPWPPNLPV